MYTKPLTYKYSGISVPYNAFSPLREPRLICSLILTQLDYCKSLLANCPHYLLDNLGFWMQLQGLYIYMCVCVCVCKSMKFDHIQPTLQTQLVVIHCSHKKKSAVSFSSISGKCPQYFSDLLQPSTPTRILWSSTCTFVTRHVNTQNIWWKIVFLCWPICLE